MEARRYMQAAHRWLGLALAVQVTLWMLSGVVMSWFAIEDVKGESTAAVSAPPPLSIESYFPPAGVLAQFEGATDLRLKYWNSIPVYLVASDTGAALFDADTGERLSPIGEATARKIAILDYVGTDEVSRVRLMTKPPPEYRGKTPVWRVDFADRNETRIYVSPDTGEVVARRNRIWRFYDFFWMLHIMDYEERENANNPLIKTFSATGLLFAFSGLWLVLVRLANGRYRSDAGGLLKAGRFGRK